MRALKLKASTSAIAALVLASALAPLVATAQAIEPITIRYAHGFSPKSFTGIHTQQWADLAKSKSNGRITIQIFPAGQLYNMTALPEAVSTGVIESGINMTPYSVQLVPEVAIWQLPSLFRNDEDAYKVATSKVTAMLADKFAAKGLQVIGWWPFGGFQWYGNKPLRLPTDMKGLKVRVNTDTHARLVESVGGAAVFIEGNEVYAAMQRGTIDAYTNAASTLVDRKLMEVTKYGIDVSGGYAYTMITFNANAWKRYPEPVRRILVAAADEIRVKMQEALTADETGKLNQALQKGLQFHRPNAEEQAAWRKAGQVAWQDYLKRTGKSGEALLQAALAATGQK